MATSLAPEDRLRISPDVRARPLDDEVVVLDIRGGAYYSLNPTGAEVWRGIEAGTTLGTIADQATWPVPPAERWRLVAELAADLLSRGLVERSGPA